MMEKTLILKHISRMLCLLISYSKFTRTDLSFWLKKNLRKYKINKKKRMEKRVKNKVDFWAHLYKGS